MRMMGLHFFPVPTSSGVPEGTREGTSFRDNTNRLPPPDNNRLAAACRAAPVVLQRANNEQQPATALAVYKQRQLPLLMMYMHY